MSTRQHIQLDVLEPRICFNTYTVTNGLESDVGSFRQAILSANAHPGLDTINFNIPIPGLKVYTPAALLPIITDPVVIDGTTQPGWSPGRPVLELRGSTLGGFGDYALHITGGNSTVRGLIFTQWGGGLLQQTLWLHNGNNNVVEGCWFGIDGVTGNAAAPNGNDIVLSNSSNNRIGGTTLQSRNVISGAQSAGISINPDSNSNTIQGNYIGTNASGTEAVGNFSGISVRSTNNTIGGLTPAARNLISGNREGLYVGNSLDAGTSHNLVQGNYIGTDVSGVLAVGNTDYGVIVAGASHDNLIGGQLPEARNIISANAIGIYFTGDPADYPGTPTARENTVQGNYIGLNVRGRPLSNTGDGVQIKNFSNTLIGGTTAAARNVISANGAHGVSIEATWVTLPGGTTVPGTATANLVQGNYIGLRPDGFNDEGNAMGGVYISGNFTGNGGGNTIGGVAPGAGNVISGNLHDGLRIDDAPANTVQGNLIGLDAAGTLAIPNAGSGIRVGGPNTLIGGSVAGAGNVVSGNDHVGILLALNSDGSRLLGNRVGTDISGLLARPNAVYGIDAASDRNVIGGAAAAERNLISGNASAGLNLSGNRNLVQGNYIGASPSGDSAVPNMFGINVFGGNNTIGGFAPGEGNLVSGNTQVGITVAGITANDNLIAGNLIGTDLTGGSALPNLNDGIDIASGARNRIGGSEAGAGNTIAYNGRAGVEVRGGTGNAIYGNRLFANTLMPIDLAADGPTLNDPLDPDTGPNDRQNHPQVNAAYRTTTNTVVKGALNSTPSSLFYIDVYASPASDADPTGRGEGRIYLGYTTAATDAAGNALWGQSFTTTVPIGYIVSATATRDANGSTSEFSPYVVVADQIPPTVFATFDVNLGRDHRVTFQFSEGVGPSFSAADVTFTNLTTGAVIPVATTGYNVFGNGASAFIDGIFPDGNYRVTLDAFGITDAAGNPLDGNGDGRGGDNYTYDFFFLAGDANRDRRVDFNDLVRLAQNYNTTNPAYNWSDADFNYDHTIDFADQVILAQHYNTTLPPAAMAAMSPPAMAPLIAALDSPSNPRTPFSTKKIVNELSPAAHIVTRPQKIAPKPPRARLA